MAKAHIFIVDDETKYHEILSETFSDLDISTAHNGQEAVAKLKNVKPDVIILDIVMPDMDGYEACKAIRQSKDNSTTPIVFFSGMDSLEGKLKAYDLGGNDFISKQSSNKEIRAKVLSLLNSQQERKAIKQDLEAGNCLIQNMQKESSALHLLSLFSQACQFCCDYETLATVIFNCLFKLNLRGVVYFRSDDSVYSSSGSCSRLEEELLRGAQSFGRIHSFSENRVIFNWESCSVLVKDVDDDLDSMAHFMGAIQTGIRAIEMQTNMIEKVLSLETKYLELKGRLSGQPASPRNLKEQLFDSGLVSRFDFDIDDEKHLDKILSSYESNYGDAFDDADDSVSEITTLLKQIHVPPDELKELFNKKNAIYIEPEEMDDVLF